MKVLLNILSTQLKNQNTRLFERIFDSYLHYFPNDHLIWLTHEGQTPQWLQKTTASQILTLQEDHIPLIRNIRTRKKIRSLITTLKPDIILGMEPLSIPNNFRQIYLPDIKKYLRQNIAVSAKKGQLHLGNNTEQGPAIILHSQKEKDWLTHHYPEYTGKINVLYQTAAGAIKPLEYVEKISIKEKYTDLKDYFLCAPGLDQDTVVHVLKGFSGFKKWQRSHMKCVLSVNNVQEAEAIQVLLSNYRFKSDIKVVDCNSEDYNQIIAASYAIILPDKFDNDFRLAISAMTANILLVIPTESIYTEIIPEDASLTFQYQDKDDMTRVLLESFRDETKRSVTIQKAHSITESYNQLSYFNKLRKIIDAYIQ